MTNTILNFIINLKNGSLSKKPVIVQKKTINIINILNILLKEGFLRYFTIDNRIFIYLKYKNDISIIRKIKLISKPSKRIYIKNKDIFNFKGSETLIISTSKGIITNTKAKKIGIGGELLFKIN